VEFSDALIQAYAEIPELVDHLHLPVQAGSDRVLAAMKRGHTALEYKSTRSASCARIRPDISLSSDFIVGFPGESEADFAATMKLIEDIGFDTSFSFIYSARPGTPAADLPTTRTKRPRSPAAHPPGPHQPAGAGDQPAHGRQHPAHPGHRPVAQGPGAAAGPHGEQPGGEFHTDDHGLIGQFVDVVIGEALPNSLRGELVPGSAG
jgi:tRNA-2-methylthio-N6-dimethylallyladenosine synthase